MDVGGRGFSHMTFQPPRPLASASSGVWLSETAMPKLAKFIIINASFHKNRLAVSRSVTLVASMAVRVVLVLSFVTCVLSQAPGDGEPICVQEVIDGLANPFFALHPAYPANERPLMDSRDYTGLLQAGNPPVWQHVDNDNNNTITDVTNVR